MATSASSSAHPSSASGVESPASASEPPSRKATAASDAAAHSKSPDAGLPAPEDAASLNRRAFMDLLDGAAPDSLSTLDPALESQRATAADVSRPLALRLEALEDIIDSEVGDTTLSRSRNVEREVGLRQIFLKFEGGNPTGTQKDRIAFAQSMDAVRRGFDAITVGTCGNYGSAIALAASVSGLRCIVYIPDGYHSKRIDEIRTAGAEIISVPGDYEHAVVASRIRADRDEIYDANPGGANTALQLRAYAEIAYEIYDDLRDAPAAVAVPVSNGTCLAGVYKGFISLYRRGKTSRIPRMIAGSSLGQNPIIESFVRGSSRCTDLDPEEIRETEVNEPLINWHSIDGEHALDAVRMTKGWAGYVSDKAMLSYSRLLREREGLSVLPASTAGLAVLLDMHRKDAFPGDRYVAVLTGKKS